MVSGQHRLNLGSRSKKQVPVLKSEAPLAHFARLCTEMNALSLATDAKSAHAIASYPPGIGERTLQGSDRFLTECSKSNKSWKILRLRQKKLRKGGKKIRARKLEITELCWKMLDTALKISKTLMVAWYS